MLNPYDEYGQGGGAPAQPQQPPRPKQLGMAMPALGGILRGGLRFAANRPANAQVIGNIGSMPQFQALRDWFGRNGNAAAGPRGFGRPMQPGQPMQPDQSAVNANVAAALNPDIVKPY